MLWILSCLSPIDQRKSAACFLKLKKNPNFTGAPIPFQHLVRKFSLSTNGKFSGQSLITRKEESTGRILFLVLDSPDGLVRGIQKTEVSSLDPELYLWKSVGRLTTPVNQGENMNNKNGCLSAQWTYAHEWLVIPTSICSSTERIKKSRIIQNLHLHSKQEDNFEASLKMGVQTL